MQPNNSTDNIFQFVQIRPPQLVEPEDPVPVRSNTLSANELLESKLQKRSDSDKSPRKAVSQDVGLNAEQIHRGLIELSKLDRLEFLHIPNEVDDENGERHVIRAFSLNDRGQKLLSEETKQVLNKLEIDISNLPINRIISFLESEALSSAYRAVKDKHVNKKYMEDIEPGPNLLRPAGVADLLVVKQKLKRYDRADIAHVENILIGEKKSRTHRALERTEETFITERETTIERETELETTDRFEMNRETSRTVNNDQQFGFGLSLSGKYGPTVEFSSNAEASTSTSTEEVTRSATTYAQDIVGRSLERVVERVREEQIRKITREVEETNLHELNNETGEHVIGMYQFLEKVYESQVFNYGIREMFDFMVPEPASYVWHLKNSPDTDLNLPIPPPRLEVLVPDASFITYENYRFLAAQYGASEIQPPPPFYKTFSAALKHGESEGDEKGQPRSILEKELTVPEGYLPYRGLIRALALTDDTLTLGITVGHTTLKWRPNASELTDVGDGHNLGASRVLEFDLTAYSHPHDEPGKLPAQIVAFETNTFAVAIEVIYRRNEERWIAWQLKTYEAIASAYREELLKYERKVEELKANAEAEAARGAVEFGSPPSQNLKTIKAELKKHCISIITRQRYDEFDATQDGDPPFFDFEQAASQGYFIRFFEQAFEWDQMQYVFYPYFWARKETWAQRFLRQDIDPAFLEFLQAGEARVVISVRPGFELAVAHYLETGNIWNGTGEPPEINSPLYVPILEEIKERTGADQGETPVSEPWDTHIPTSLVVLRREPDLPKWVRPNPEEWSWEEAQAVMKQ